MSKSWTPGHKRKRNARTKEVNRFWYAEKNKRRYEDQSDWSRQKEVRRRGDEPEGVAEGAE